MDNFLTQLYEEEQEKVASADMQEFMDTLSVRELEAFLGLDKSAPRPVRSVARRPRRRLTKLLRRLTRRRRADVV